MSRQTHLGALLMATGHHLAAWSPPCAPRAGVGIDQQPTPELPRRDPFRDACAGRALHEYLGFARPATRRFTWRSFP